MRRRTGWGILALLAVVPLIAAGFSPQLAWRDPIYIASGFAGVAALSAMLLQGLLAGKSDLLGLGPSTARRLHRGVGLFLVLAVAAHVAGLYLTSPLDVMDVFLLRAPTVYSFWGLLALYALLATVAMAVFRRRLRLSPKTWRHIHGLLAAVTVTGTVAHTLLIQGTMEPVTKAALCLGVMTATAVTVFGVKRQSLFRTGFWSAQK